MPLPRLRAQFGPVWATVIVAFCTPGLVQMGYNLQGPVMMISIASRIPVGDGLVTLATGAPGQDSSDTCSWFN